MPTIVFDGPAPADFVSSDDHVSALVRRRAWMPKKTRRCARTLTSGAFPPHQVYDVHVSVGAATFAYTVTAFDALSMGVALCDAVDLNGFLGCPLLHQLPGRFNGKVFYKATCGVYGVVHVYSVGGDWWISADLGARGGFARNTHDSAQPSDVSTHVLCSHLWIQGCLLRLRCTCIAKRPTALSTRQPSFFPTATPSPRPSAHPTRQPTATPTRIPTFSPTSMPSHRPTVTPTLQPSDQPTPLPSASPTTAPTNAPSLTPTTVAPTYGPGHPTPTPTLLPTQLQTQRPTVLPTRAVAEDNAQATAGSATGTETAGAVAAIGVVLLLLAFLFVRQHRSNDPVDTPPHKPQPVGAHQLRHTPSRGQGSLPALSASPMYVQSTVTGVPPVSKLQTAKSSHRVTVRIPGQGSATNLVPATSPSHAPSHALHVPGHVQGVSPRGRSPVARAASPLADGAVKPPPRNMFGVRTTGETSSSQPETAVVESREPRRLTFLPSTGAEPLPPMVPPRRGSALAVVPATVAEHNESTH
eukprot:m.1259878 g.1259878  ORF g.1259878 m.1259878 type:complete len:527 (-) comp24725_c0_seq54:1374-2954(-)